MNDNILQELKEVILQKHCFNELTPFGVLNAMDDYAYAYHERMKQEERKAEQKQYLVELTRLGDEPVAPKVEGDELLINAIDNLIIEVYSGMSLENIEEELKAIKEMIVLKPIAGFCFTENDINDLIPGPYHPEGTQIKKVLAKLNTKANQYAEERIRKSLEKAAENAKIITKAMPDYDGVRRDFKVVDKDSITSKDNYQ